ncbi:hypothetical protein PV08_01511 [Exophiala spinifera]|uniref:TAFII55 protein conserved region domain-containing protein n=1 Tax=Exophiala spinifera TaxID=91928 RepID=A0A0D2A829_9EURO|nr:uncharacterized protein PV08_01511 [Exophiala spinifera]KIW20932.1 hypothetical protein PV08_01511 [Exophiala spinifera]
MAGRKKQQRKPVAAQFPRLRPVEILKNGKIEPLEETPATSFLTLKLDPTKLARFPAASKVFNPCAVKVEKNDNNPSGHDEDQNVTPAAEESAWTSDPTINAADESAGDGEGKSRRTNVRRARLRHPPPYEQHLEPAKSTLVPPGERKRLRERVSSTPAKKVKINPVVEVVSFDPTAELNGSRLAPGAIDHDPDCLISHSPSSFLRLYDADQATEASDVASDITNDTDMSEAPEKSGQRPQLKLKLSKPQLPHAGSQPPVQTPAPTSAIRTPSIKLKLGGPSAGSANAPKPSPSDTVIVSTPASSSQKKRKRVSKAADSEDESTAQPTKPRPAPIPKLTLKTPSVPAGPAKPATATTVKLKAKGKIPKRPIGVGYDSELDEKENDPMIHEGFILRMQPGPDCDYLRKAIEEGTVHLPRSKGGADVKMRMLDTLGRRGIMIIRGNQYAITMVDLPCIIEGMKSWDKKGWIKSIDVCQMLLVLGRCNTDEEARNYPLPEDVDPKNYQYAHGITAPMKWVRKRRFARTKRTRVDDIESVERRVKALLEADKAAKSVRYQLLDHDPRLDEERYSSGLGEDEDAEAEEDEEPDDYFAPQNGHHTAVFDTPMLTETPVEDIGQDEVDEFERMFADDDAPEPETSAQAQSTLHPPEAGDSSFPVTSTSASPSATVAHTPASAVDQSSDSDDDEGGDEDGDLDDADKEGDDNLQQVKDRIEDMQQKIAEQTELLKKTQNAILKKKLARKIQDLKDDVAMMKKNAGLGGDEDDD